MLDGLAFFPVDDISAAMVYLKIVVPGGLDPLVNYIDGTYVSGSYCHVQIPLQQGVDSTVVSPALAHQDCFLHLCGTCMMQQYEKSRTNNSCEGWNNAFSQLVGHAHQTIWRATDSLLKDCAIVPRMIAATVMLRNDRGEHPKKWILQQTTYLQDRLPGWQKDHFLDTNWNRAQHSVEINSLMH